MKKKLLLYLIVTTTLLISLFSGYFILNSVRKGQTYTEISLTNDLAETLFNNTEFNFKDNYIHADSYNDSVSVNKLIPIDTSGILSLGTSKNSTNDDHGFVDYFGVSGNLGSIDVDLLDSYVDDNGINETIYTKGHSVESTLDGLTDYKTIALLKNIDGASYAIDFLELSSNTLTYNSTYNVPLTLLETVYDFEFTDVDNDFIAELYLVGLNKSDTQVVLLELTYDVPTKTFELNNQYSWDSDSTLPLDLKQFHEVDKVYFVMTNLFTAVPIKTNVVVFSTDKNPVRTISLESNLTISTSGSDVYRAYGVKLYETNIAGEQGLALFGTYIVNGLDNYPSCMQITITNGVVAYKDEFRMDYTPGWSLDGLPVDIDLDGEDEIIMTTYDLLSPTQSNFSVFTSSTLEEFDAGTSPLSRLRSSTLITQNNLHISAFLAKTATHDILSFRTLHHIPFEIKNIGDVLYQGQQNNFTIETKTLTGEVANRNDITIEFGLDGLTGSLQSLSSLPADVSIDIPLYDGLAMFDVAFNITKGSDIVHEDTKTLTADYSPEFRVTFPEKIVVIRYSESSRVLIVIGIDNKLSQSLDLDLIISDETQTLVTQQGLVPSKEFNEINVEVGFGGTVPASTNIELITFTFESDLGIFEIEIPILVTNQFRLLPYDFIIMLCVAFAGVLIGYVLFATTIHKVTKEAIKDHYTTGKPLKIDFPNFKTRAMKSVMGEYIQTENWKAGIKIAQDTESPYLFSFRKYKVQAKLKKGQELLDKGKFEEAISYWDDARETLEEIGTNEQQDTLEWLLSPLRNIVTALTKKKGTDKATLLQKEFENLNDMRELRKAIFNVVIEIPLYIVAEQLGIAFRDAEELQSSLNYLQLAYQYAPTEEKNRIVTEITGLISLGVTPTEFSLPVDQKEIRERLAKRTLRCFSCGEERTNVNEPCSNCGVDTVQCSVCKLPISFGSDYLECSHCQNIAHKEHLLEWIKVKGTCPVCQQKLSAENFSV
jgi:hypothetical protein